jgi:hypothetical protein
MSKFDIASLMLMVAGGGCVVVAACLFWYEKKDKREELEAKAKAEEVYCKDPLDAILFETSKTTYPLKRDAKGRFVKREG